MIRFCLIVALSSAWAVAEAPPAGGLEAVLRHAEVGVSFEAFIAEHPDAVYSDAERRDMPLDAEAPGALLLTYAEDPFLDVNAFANFGFRDGRLYELVAVWSGTPEAIQARRRRFFTAAAHRHGLAYTRETLLVYPHTAEEQAVAAFCWQDSDATTLAFYTESSPIAAVPRAVLTYAQFSPQDPFLADILTKYKPTPEQCEQAWQDMADIVERIEASR